MNSQLRVGIIGCGVIGKKRAKIVKEDPKCCLCCAADISIENIAALKEFANDKFKMYKDWTVMLKNEPLDIVIVSTPNCFLKKIVIRAAQKKLNILCEKPLGKNAQESKQMVETARANNIVLKTGFNHRYHPAVFKAHSLITADTIGSIYLIKCVYGHGGRPGYEKEWRANRKLSGGGELLDQGVHVVDLFRWFMGDFNETFGYITNFYWNMEVEDNAFAYFKTAEGKMAVMHTSWTQWKNKFIFEIYGESGYIIVDGLGGSYGAEKLTIGLKRKAIKNIDTVKEKKYLSGVPDEEIVIFDGQDTSWKDEWDDFTTAIREKREPLGNGIDGLQANRMLAAVYRSAKNNQPVKINRIKI